MFSLFQFRGSADLQACTEQTLGTARVGDTVLNDATAAAADKDRAPTR